MESFIDLVLEASWYWFLSLSWQEKIEPDLTWFKVEKEHIFYKLSRNIYLCTDAKVSEREEVLQTLEQTTLQPEVKPVVKQLCPCNPWRSTVERDPPAACGKLHDRAGGWAKDSLTLPEDSAWRKDPQQDLWPQGREEITLEQVCWQDLWPHGALTLELSLKDWTLWKGSMLEQSMKNCSLWEEPTMKKLVGTSLWEGPNAGAGQECEEALPWGGRSCRHSVWCTEHNPSPCPPAMLGGTEGQSKSRAKLSLERKE